MAEAPALSMKIVLDNPQAAAMVAEVKASVLAEVGAFCGRLDPGKYYTGAQISAAFAVAMEGRSDAGH